MSGKRILPPKTAGDDWRVQGMISAVNTAALGAFDEIVVGRGPHDAWLHVEMMDNKSAFVQLGERCFWIYIPAKGAPRITMEETRPWVEFKACRKRPGGHRCRVRRGHDGPCITSNG